MSRRLDFSLLKTSRAHTSFLELNQSVTCSCATCMTVQKQCRGLTDTLLRLSMRVEPCLPTADMYRITLSWACQESCCKGTEVKRLDVVSRRISAFMTLAYPVQHCTWRRGCSRPPLKLAWPNPQASALQHPASSLSLPPNSALCT